MGLMIAASSNPGTVFVTGATGYLGQPLLVALLERDYRVLALARAQSVHKLPSQVEAVIGDALDGESYAHAIPQGATLIHLVGVAHPSPWKSRQFETIDLASARAAIGAAKQAKVGHFIYLSVARPAPVMQSYQAARAQAEQLIRESGIAATFVRPWYVLGPGHRWPYLLFPFYALLYCIPGLRASVQRLRFVTRAQIVRALLHAVQHRPHAVQAIEISDIIHLSEAKLRSA
jgi:uncharacterized protein YbjT (DUF2867 family)